MKIEELLEKDSSELTLEENLVVQNYLIELLMNQAEHQRVTIKLHEDQLNEQTKAITELQTAMIELYKQFDVVKNATGDLGDGYKSSDSGIIFR